MARRSSRGVGRRWTLAALDGLTERRVQTAAPRPTLSERARILGLDPGSLVTGYAVIDCSAGQSKYLACGSIRTQGPLPERLADIFAAVAHVARQWQPDEVAIERVFMHRNADSALKLGQARGAALSGVFAGRPKVFEYSAREVKQAVVGTGAAQKPQVQMMVKHLLKLTGVLQADAADALAIALCHAHSRRVAALLGQSDKQAKRAQV